MNVYEFTSPQGKICGLVGANGAKNDIDSSLIQFTSPTKGFFLLDGKNTNFTQSPYLQFPENLKWHWILMPFDTDVNDCMLWEQAVKLLNADGNPLVPISGDAVKLYDGLQYASPYKAANGTEMIIGYCLYSQYQNNINNYYLHIYKWSKVVFPILF